jgi:hypothetical protein
VKEMTHLLPSQKGIKLTLDQKGGERALSSENVRERVEKASLRPFHS